MGEISETGLEMLLLIHITTAIDKLRPLKRKMVPFSLKLPSLRNFRSVMHETDHVIRFNA